MNNKIISAIAEQAKLGGANFENNVKYYVGTEETFVKFAELIIDACIKSVIFNGMNEEHYYIRLDAADDIKKRFEIFDK